MQATSNYLTCAGREIHFMEWGSPDLPAVIAWHGLARTGRDMDDLAEYLSGRYRVICPDTLGRGLSQWSPDPDNEYCLAFYARIAADLIAQLQLKQVLWVGTSMGGAIGTVCASGLLIPELKQTIRGLVLNDNAPELAPAAIERIKAYAGQPPVFATMAELDAFFRTVYKPFGWQSDAQWRRLAETSARRLPDGRLTPHYDPAMVRQFHLPHNDYELWEHYDALTCPVLCLHGMVSDLVLPATIEAMGQRGPGALGRLQVLEVPEVGHAPALNVESQLRPIAEFLSAALQA